MKNLLKPGTKDFFDIKLDQRKSKKLHLYRNWPNKPQFWANLSFWLWWPKGQCYIKIQYDTLHDFGRSVNPNSTRGRSRLCPLYYSTLRIFRPSYGPDLYSSKWARWRYRLGKIQICIIINCRKLFQETRWLVLQRN